ncbi:MAG TPA: hypothetical protein VKE72_08575 [Methylocella sp.]|nr:hypothetical protein [Methylocella sp.]
MQSPKLPGFQGREKGAVFCPPRSPGIAAADEHRREIVAACRARRFQ